MHLPNDCYRNLPLMSCDQGSRIPMSSFGDCQITSNKRQRTGCGYLVQPRHFPRRHGACVWNRRCAHLYGRTLDQHGRAVESVTRRRKLGLKQDELVGRANDQKILRGAKDDTDSPSTSWMGNLITDVEARLRHHEEPMEILAGVLDKLKKERRGHLHREQVRMHSRGLYVEDGHADLYRRRRRLGDFFQAPDRLTGNRRRRSVRRRMNQTPLAETIESDEPRDGSFTDFKDNGFPILPGGGRQHAEFNTDCGRERGQAGTNTGRFGDWNSSANVSHHGTQREDGHQGERHDPSNENADSTTEGNKSRSQWPLEAEEYQRYGRQLIMPEIGLQGQLRLKHASVLVIGVGGLGCPAAAYLSGAGVGRLGLVDGDSVEASNLHRQILHSTSTVGMSKVASATRRLQELNPLVEYTPHLENLTPQSALGILGQYDLVLDCTDHPTTRYLISDACVLLQKPLVSASALRSDGQLTVLNDPPLPAGNEQGGPCYRCVWPRPPNSETITSCSDGGILGPVVGVMGVLMAFEAIKIITKGLTMPNEKSLPQKQASMLLLSGYGPRLFQSIKLPGRRRGCPACSGEATITRDSLLTGDLDYVAFCGVSETIKVLRPDQRLKATDFAALSNRAEARETVIDVRERVQFELCHLPGSVNVPFSEITAWQGPQDIAPELKVALGGRMISSEQSQDGVTVVEPATSATFICRLGNDSQLAIQKLAELGVRGVGLQLRDVEGGFAAWRRDVDSNWPDY